MILRVQRESYPDIKLMSTDITYDPILPSIIVEKMSFYFRNISRLLTKVCHEVTLATHTDGQRFTHFRNSYLFVHTQ